jgi:hypothetical protein
MVVGMGVCVWLMIFLIGVVGAPRFVTWVVCDVVVGEESVEHDVR